MDPGLWGLERRNGRLFMQGQDLAALAASFGTPLHVVSASSLRRRCRELSSAFEGYPRRVRLHFSYKTNSVAGVLQVLHDCGLAAEVVDGHELWLALRLGLDPADVVFNGPNKSPDELHMAVESGVGLIVVDGFGELQRLGEVTARLGRVQPIALRICPDVTPRGMNPSSVAGSRRCQFGFDLRSNEVKLAVEKTARLPGLRLRGAMAHIGSGIRDLASIRATIERLLGTHAEMLRVGIEPDLLDVGGGLGTRLSREFTTFEMLAYLGLGRLPRPPKPAADDLFSRYGVAVTEAVGQGARRFGVPVPELIVEPGRAVVSDAQVLLLTVGAVRERRRLGHYALTDGGAMTVSLMFLSEHHTVVLANRDPGGKRERISVFGKLPSPMDAVYRNLTLPRLQEGDVLAIMDAGAYFTATATNFGGPRAAVVLVDGSGARLVRRRETSEDLVAAELVLPPPSAGTGRDS
jgi:diaminopimelate decarboxylase